VTPILLEQAIQNLATNAIRYSDRESKITFSLDVNGEQVSIRVENSGTPISESDQDRIFERFYRVDAARSSRKYGVGLGLSLSREIVRAHGGELFLEKSDSTQTVFVMELPV
jgi:signal transduction histidine kinase